MTETRRNNLRIITGSARLPGDYGPLTEHEIRKRAEWEPGSVAPAAEIVPATWNGNVLTICVPCVPVGKPRMTRRDKWKQRPAVMRYREFADRVRAAAGKVPAAEQVKSLSWLACFAPPPSWPKEKRINAIGRLHRVKPDRDNLDKAILDALYPDGDQAIAVGKIQKVWDWRPSLEIRIEV